MRECIWCGESFLTKYKQSVYCSEECKKLARNKQRQLCYFAHKNDVKEKPVVKQKKKMTIEEVCKLAKAEGLSYGRYVEKYGV